MNLRISKDSLRFRITRDELSELIKNECLSMESPITSGIQKYTISIQNTQKPLHLEETSNEVTLFVDTETLINFQKQLPSREGIKGEYVSRNGVAISISLEIDIKKSNN